MAVFFKIKKGKAINLPSERLEGTVYITTDENKMYIDLSSDEGGRICLNAKQADILTCGDVGATNKPVYFVGGEPQQCLTYAGGTRIKLNGTTKGSTTVTVWTPSSAGTAGQLLVSTGAAPAWSSTTYSETKQSTGRTTAGTITSLGLYGQTYGNDAAYLAASGKLSYGDPGPQINFGASTTSGQKGAIIFTDHDTIGTGASFSFVSTESNTWLIAPTIKALTKFIGTLQGNATTASALETKRKISLTGDVTGSVVFDGSADASITATVADDSHNHVIGNVDGLQDALNNKMTASPTYIEFNTNGTLKGYGGYIDFHYHNSEGKPTNAAGEVISATPDYTSRIYEDAAGRLTINGVQIKGGMMTGSLKGNAETATALETARKINGTEFDGSADITTANWGTARTISISSTAGTTGTSVNGSKNISLIIPSTLTGFSSIASSNFRGIVRRTFERDTSNAIHGITWYDANDTTLHQYIMGHNTSNAIIINPKYDTTKDAWSSAYGLYISDSQIKFNNFAILNASNYTDYTVKKDGTGATGTWGISITGNAGTATKFSSARTIALTGDITGSSSTNGSSGWSIATSLPLRLKNYQSSGLEDANTATETGFYYMTTTATNRPSFIGNTANKDYRILTTAYSSAWLQQIATDFRCNEIYYRRCENGTWKPWIEILTSDLVLNNTSVAASGWSDTTTAKRQLVNHNTLAYWNGAYSGTNSNLTYCKHGAFGTMATKNSGSYYTTTEADNRYVNVTGDTMSGNLNMKGTNPYIGFQNSSGTVKGYVQYIESSDNYAIGAGVAKSLAISNTGSITIPANQTFTPLTTNTGSVGTNSAKWNAMYATTFHGALNGNASTATSATNASKLTVHTTLTPETADGFLEKGVVKWACSGTEVVGNDGMIMSFGWSDSYGAQIWLDDGNGEGGMKIRNRGSSGTAWNPWRQVLTEYNYNSYSPTLTGGGASGTWSINVTGSAGSLTSNAGSSTKAIYFTGGKPSQCGDSLDHNARGVYASGYGNGNFTWNQTSASFADSAWYNGWASYLISNHGDGSSYYNQIIALPFWGPPAYRRLEGGTAKGWYDFITDENSQNKSIGYMQTWYTDKSKTYGTQYPLYAWWETSNICKLTVDNYTTKVDQAVALTTNAGSSTQPVYFSGGKPVACTAYSGLLTAFSSSTNTLSITVGGTTKTATAVNSVSNAWEAGTSAGPKIKTTVNGKTGTAVAIPKATASASGVVTTGTQTFAGAKTFNSIVKSGNYFEATAAKGGMWISGTHEASFVAGVATTAASGQFYQGWFSGKTQSGAWSLGALSGSEDLYFVYGTDADYKASTNTTVQATRISASTGRLFGAAWNDYAEYRVCQEDYKPGQVVCENGDDTLSIATRRLQPGANVVSDTFGFAIGETELAKCPIAVSGRVLVYTYEPREEFKPGEAVCAGPNGTVSRMTREEIREYPECIIGTVSAVPTYETWGQTDVPVDGRIWIKIK